MAVNLSINLNKVALLRNQRDGDCPDLQAAGRTVLAAGADGLTVHPRPDERHVRRADVSLLSALVAAERNRRPGVEFNLEGNPFGADYMALCRAVRPDQATLVPDAPDARTSDAGWDLRRDGPRLRPLIAALRTAGCRVSLFMEADAAAMAAAAALGADRVELYTGPYAAAFAAGSPANATLARYAEAARAAEAAGLGVNAGHDLNLRNLPAFCAALPGLREVSIGHAFTADALWMGFDAAVRGYLAALGRLEG